MIKNILAYFNERFPLINMALFAILFITVFSVATFFSSTSSSYGTAFMIAGASSVISFFFRLRVFDEIKDYDLDIINHPQRVLQSGRVNIRQLMLISSFGTVLEIVWSLWAGFPTLIAWVVAVIYSLLMRYEFFVSDFLKKRLLLYAISHMVIMPLVILWVYVAFIQDASKIQPLIVLAALSLLSGFSFEISRKIHSEDAERETVDSYSKSIGFATAIFTVLAVLLVGIAFQFYLLYLLKSSIGPFIIIGVLYFFTIILYVNALLKPREKLLRIGEKFVSLFMLASYLSIIFVVNF